MTSDTRLAHPKMRADVKDVEAIVAHLERAGRRVSDADVAAGTGIDLGTARIALHDLMRVYECRLAVREDGTLLYDFGKKPRRLTQRTWRERLRSAGRWLWRGFRLVYQSSLAVVLVAYAVVFVLVILAAAIAAAAASENDDVASGAFHLVGGIFRGIFEFATFIAIDTYVMNDRYGYPHRHYRPRPPTLRVSREPAKTGAKAFIASVYDFVFGPTRVQRDDRAQSRETAAFVRKNGGVLTIADVQALSGHPRDKAETFFAAFVAEFDGTAEITEDGVLYARIPELLASDDRAQDAPIVLFWNEYEPPHELTGNSTGKNLAVAGLGAFNLVSAGVIMTADASLAPVWLGAIPATIFGLFFLIPLARAPWVWVKNQRWHRTNIRKRIYRAAFEGLKARPRFPELVAHANSSATSEESLVVDAIAPLLDETTAELGGTIDVDDDGARIADLTRLRAELDARPQLALPAPESPIVHTTD